MNKIQTVPHLGPKLSSTDWREEQPNDLDIGPVLKLVERKEHLQYKLTNKDSRLTRTLIKYRKDLAIKNGLLYKKAQLKHFDQSIMQFVLPSTFCKRTLQSLHDDMGHVGMDQTFNLVQERFFWPKMNEEVKGHICACERCIQFKQPQKCEELHPIESSYPMELVHMDFVTIGKIGETKLLNILVITNHFTKYAQAFVTPKQTAPVVAKTLWEQYLVHYGWPSQIMTDQGRSFKSSLIKELCTLAQTKKIRTTPNRLESNGACEQFNAPLISIIGTLNPDKKKDWPEWVSALTYAYFCTVSMVTGFMPYYLMYGRRPLITIDIEYGVTLSGISDKNWQNFVQKLEAQLKWAFKTAKEHAEKEMVRHKHYHNCKMHCMRLEVGDQDLVHIKAFSTDHKIADKWENDPDIVEECMVQKVKPVHDRTGTKSRILHRDMLYPLMSNTS